MRQPIYNVQLSKTAIFANLRTFEAKNPLKSMLAHRELTIIIPEKFEFFIAF